MRRRDQISFLVALALIIPALAAPALGGRSDRPPSMPAGLEDADGLFLLEESATGEPPPDLGVVVAAPRAAITGRSSGVLSVERPGRRLNVEQGETIRFVSGIREAIWYAGRGLVRSGLAILRPDPSGDPVTLGRDGLELKGAAPRIDHGRVHVDLPFDDLGTFPLIAHVRVAAVPREGRRSARAVDVPFQVRVWERGQLGSLAGFVGRESDGLPLGGMPVVALDAATGEPVSAARSRCDGSFVVDRLPAGEYLLAIPPRGGFGGEYWDDVIDPAAATPILLAAGEEAGGFDFLLARP